MRARISHMRSGVFRTRWRFCIFDALVWTDILKSAQLIEVCLPLFARFNGPVRSYCVIGDVGDTYPWSTSHMNLKCQL